MGLAHAPIDGVLAASVYGACLRWGSVGLALGASDRDASAVWFIAGLAARSMLRTHPLSLGTLRAARERTLAPLRPMGDTNPTLDHSVLASRRRARAFVCLPGLSSFNAIWVNSRIGDEWQPGWEEWI